MLAEIVEIYTADFIEAYFTSIGFDGSALREVVELSQGADTTTGDTEANTFVASQATLGEGDVVDGGAGIDVFNYTSSGSVPVTHSGFTLQNIEILNIASNATGGTTLDLSNSTDIEKIVIEPSTSEITLIAMDEMPLLDLTSIDQNSRFITLEGAESITFSSTSVSALNRHDGYECPTGLPTDEEGHCEVHVGRVPPIQTIKIDAVGGTLLVGRVDGGSTTPGISGSVLTSIDVIGTGPIDLGSIKDMFVGGMTLSLEGSTGSVSAFFTAEATRPGELLSGVPAAKTISVDGGSGKTDITFDMQFVSQWGTPVDIDGGSGAETITFLGNATGGGFGLLDSFDGGAGIDTLIVEAGDYSNAEKSLPFQSVVNTEILSFINKDGADVVIDHNLLRAGGVPVFTTIQHNATGDFTVINAGSDTVFEFGTLSSTAAARFFTSSSLNLSLNGNGTSDSPFPVLSLNTTSSATVNLTSISSNNSVGTWINQAGATLTINGSGNTAILGMSNAGTIDGSDATGNLTLVGSTGSDTFKSGLGNDSFEGLSGADTFEFGSNWGQDTVQDFTANTDKIVFEESIFLNFADMLNHTSQSGTSVVIQDGSNRLTLADINVADLVAGDFQVGAAVVDTVSATIGTLSSVSVGSSVTGNIDYANDQDWYAITLSVGNTYTFTIAGDDTSGSALSSPSLLLNNSSGGMIGSENFGENSSSTNLIYTPTVSEVYYIAANGLNSTTGSFLLDVQSTVIDPDTVGHTVGTASTVSVGSSITGNIDHANDQDWYAVTLSADTVYNFSLEGSATSAGTLSNPELHLYDSLGNYVRSDYDGGVGANASLNYSPTTSGQYYISAQDALSATGSFLLEVNSYSSPINILTVNDSLPTIYDIDRYPGVALTAGVYYEIDVYGLDSGYGTFSHPKVAIHNDDFSFSRSDDGAGIGNDPSLGFVIEETGVYAINVFGYTYSDGSPFSDDAGTYQLSIVGYSATNEIWG